MGIRNDLEAAMRSGDSMGVSKIRDEAESYGLSDVMRQAERNLRAIEKANARAERERIKGQKAMEREAAQQAKDAASKYKSGAIAFFTEGTGASRVVKPITAPSGGVMKKYDKTGVLWDSISGLPYARNELTGQLAQIDPVKDGKTVTKDGHVYKVVDGMAWEWVGFDPNAVGNDPALAKELKDKAAELKKESEMANSEASMLKRDIASDESRLRDLEKQKKLASGDEYNRLQGEIDKLKNGITAKKDKLELAEVESYKAMARRKEFDAEAEQKLSQDLANRKQLAYTGDPKGGMGVESAIARAQQAQQNASNFNPDFTIDLGGDFGKVTIKSTDFAKNIKGVGLQDTLNEMTKQDSLYLNQWGQQMSESLAKRDEAKTKQFFQNKSIQDTIDLVRSQKDIKLTGVNDKGQPTGMLNDPKLSPELKTKIQNFVDKTGVTSIPASWQTQEAQEARANAGQYGYYDVSIPKNFALKDGKITTTKEESASIWGVNMPWNTSKEVNVGTYQFDKNGVPFIELDKNNRLSPSQMSGNPYDGVKEYMPMPDSWEEQFIPKDPRSVSSFKDLQADTRESLIANYNKELSSYQQTAKDAWAGQKMDAGRVRDTLDRWTVATPAQRQELIAELDPRQANIPAGDRRLDTRALFEAGVISAQDGRLFEKAFYGSEPTMPNVNEAWEDWKNKSAKGQEYTTKATAIGDSTITSNLLSFLPSSALKAGAKAVLDSSVLGTVVNADAKARLTELEANAKQQFLTDYYQENSRRVDFSDKEFTQTRDALLKDVPIAEWANKGIVDMVNSTAGSAIGIIGGTAALVGDWAVEKVTGYKMLNDQEKQIIGQQTAASLRNMSMAVADRLEPLAKVNAMLSPGTGMVMAALGAYDKNAPSDLWTGKTQGQLNRAWDSLISDIDNGTLTEEKFKAHEKKINALTTSFSDQRAKASGWMSGINDGADYRMSWENELSNPKSAMGQFLAAYQQTRDPRLAAQAKAASFNSQSELEVQRAASDYAAMNGKISETTPFGGFQSAVRGGYVAPLTEQAIELASNIAGFATGGALWGVKALGTTARAGSALNKAAKAVNLFEDGLNVAGDAFRGLGKIERLPGTSLTTGQKLWNTGVDAAKQYLASGGGEFLEEAIASFGEAGSSFGDALNQGISGAIGGVGMSVVHGGVGYAANTISSGIQQAKREQAETKALTKFVEEYNKTNTSGTPLTLDVARQAQAYQSPATVSMLKDQRKDLITRLSDVNAEIKALPPAPIISQTPTTSGKLSPSKQKRYEDLKSKSEGSVGRTITLPDGRTTRTQAISGQKLSAVEQNEFNELQAEIATGKPAPAFKPINRRESLLKEKQQIEGQLAANILDTTVVGEQSFTIAKEINKLPEERRALVDAAVRAANGSPLTEQQENLLINHPTKSGAPAAYTYGETSFDFVLSDELRDEIKQIAPETAKTPAIRKTQAERDAELRAKYGGVFRYINGKQVFIADKPQGQAAVTPKPQPKPKASPRLNTDNITPPVQKPTAPATSTAPTAPVQSTPPATTPATQPAPLKPDAPLNQRKARAKTMWDAAKPGDVYYAEGGMEGEKFRIEIKANKNGTRYAEITGENGGYVDSISLDREGSDPTIGNGLIYGADMVAAPTAPAQKSTSVQAAPNTQTSQQVPAPIPVTPPVTERFQTQDGQEATGTFEKQPDGNWQQTSPEAPTFIITPADTQFYQALEDKAAYALNPQSPDPVQPGEYKQAGYTAIEPAATSTPADTAINVQPTQADSVAPATLVQPTSTDQALTQQQSQSATTDAVNTSSQVLPPPIPVEAYSPQVFMQPVNRGSALLMLQTAAPWVSSAPIVVRSPRFFINSAGNKVIDAEQHANLPANEKADYSPNQGALFALDGKIHVDEAALVDYINSTAPELRQAKIKAALREEVIHVATMNVRNNKQISEDWNMLPDEAKRRVIETYFTSDLERAGGDWTQVEVPAFNAGAEFWRMYLNAVTEGRTTEQVDLLTEVAEYAKTNPSFAVRIKQALEDIARWLREELLGSLDPDARVEFEQAAQQIEAEVVRLEQEFGMTNATATPEAEAASPLASPVVEANAPPALPAETISTDTITLPEKPKPKNQAYVPKPAAGSSEWRQEAVYASLTSGAAALGYKIVDTGIASPFEAYGKTLNWGTQLYDKLNPGNEIGQWIDAMNAGTNPAGNAIIQAASEPGLHRVWFGHDFATNLDNVVAEFGWSSVPDYIGQLLKDSLTKSGIPFPGVELLVQSGAVSDRTATDWLSTNIGEVFGGGLAFLGTYKLYKAAKGGKLSKPQVLFATVGIGLKLVSGVMTAQPFLVLSGLADTAILITNLDQVKAAFQKGIKEFNKKPKAVRDLYEQVAPPASSPTQQTLPQDGREVKSLGSYPRDAGSTPAPATNQNIEATPPPLPPETAQQDAGPEPTTIESAPPPVPSFTPLMLSRAGRITSKQDRIVAEAIEQRLLSLGALPQAAKDFSVYYVKRETSEGWGANKLENAVAEFIDAGGIANPQILIDGIKAVNDSQGKEVRAITDKVMADIKNDPQGKNLSTLDIKNVRDIVENQIAPELIRFHGAFKQVAANASALNDAGSIGLSSGRVININAASLIQKAQLNQLSNIKAVELTISEEMAHISNQIVLAAMHKEKNPGSNLDEFDAALSEAADIWETLPKELQAHVVSIYGEVDAETAGMEFLRMVLQNDIAIADGKVVGADGKVITEQTFKDSTWIESLRDVFKRVFDIFSDLKNNIGEMLRKEGASENDVAQTVNRVQRVRKESFDLYNQFRKAATQARQKAYENELENQSTAKQEAERADSAKRAGVFGIDGGIGRRSEGGAPPIIATAASSSLDDVAKARLAKLEAAEAERIANEERAKARRAAVVQQNTGDIVDFEDTINSTPEDSRELVTDLLGKAVAGEQKAVLGVNFEKIPASYIALPPGLVQTSHIGNTFSKNPLYGGQNTRAYEKDEAEQNKVRAGAMPGALNEEILTSTDPSSANASPQIAIVIDNDDNGQPRARWQTAGGNAREMMTNLAPLEDQDRLSATWEKKASQFGFENFPEGYRGYRFLGVHDIRTPEGARRYQNLVDNLNPSTGVVQDTYDRADLDALKVPIERISKLSVTMSGSTAMNELAALMRDAESLGLERNRLAPMVKNPAQSQVYMQRLILGAAFQNPVTSNLYSELINTNKSAAMVGLIADASKTALAVREAGNSGIADALGSLLNNVGNYVLNGRGLKSALDMAASQIEADALVGDTATAISIAERLRDVVVLNKQGRVLSDATQDAWREYLDSLARSIANYDPNAWFDAPKSVPDAIIQANEAHKAFVERQKRDMAQIQARPSNTARMRGLEAKQATEELTPLEKEEYDILIKKAGEDFMEFYADAIREGANELAIKSELEQRGVAATSQQIQSRPAPSAERTQAAQIVLENTAPQSVVLNDLISKLKVAGGAYPHKVDGDFRSNWKITRDGMLLRSPIGELFVTERVKNGKVAIAPLKGGASIEYDTKVAEQLFDYQLTEIEKELEPEFISVLTEYSKIKTEYDKTLKDIVSNQNEAYAILPPLKGAPRAFEKIGKHIQEERKKNRQITAHDAIIAKGQDFLRASIIVDSKKDIMATVADALRQFAPDSKYASTTDQNLNGVHYYQSADGKITLSGEDRFAVPLPSGYSDINLKIEVAPNLYAELQIHIPEMFIAKQGWNGGYNGMLPQKYHPNELGVPDGLGHELYEELRSSSDIFRRSELEELSQELYGNAIKSHEEREGAAKSFFTASANESQETRRTPMLYSLGNIDRPKPPGKTNQVENPNSGVWKDALGVPSSSQNIVSAGNKSRFKSPSNGISPLSIQNIDTVADENLQQEKTPVDKIIFIASQIAREAHKDQFRKDGVTPYIEHIKATVARLVSEDAKIQAAAWLHDAIEDSEITAEQMVERGIPQEIVDAVILLTKKQNQSYRDYIAGVQTNEIATKVKLADMMSNLADKPSPRQIEKYTEAIQLLREPNSNAGTTAKKMIYARKKQSSDASQLGFDNLFNSVSEYEKVLEKDGITAPAEKVVAAMSDLNTNATAATELLFDFGLTGNQNNDKGEKNGNIQSRSNGLTSRGAIRGTEGGTAPAGGLGDLFQLMAEHRAAKRDSGMDERRAGSDALDGLESSRSTLGSDALREGRIGSVDRVIPELGRQFDGRGDSQRDSADAERNQEGGGVPEQSNAGIIKERPAVGSPERNFSFSRNEKLAPKGAKGKYRANLSAIKIIKAIESENRLATLEEKQALARFTGWGAVPQVFDDARASLIEGKEIERLREEAGKYRRWAKDYAGSADFYLPQAEKFDQDATTLENWKDQWFDSYQEIKSLLTPEEYLSAKKSTINAHYTSPDIIAAIWDIVEKLGFKGGNVLEPGAGIGHFFGLMPESMVDRSNLFGVELDSFTSRILKALYPEANIQNTGFQIADIADNSIDLEISNVPFANVPVVDKGLELMGGPVDNLHDYFFGKGLMKLKPGGLQVFITSAFTLDKGSPENRRWLADKADLVAAYRLPNDAFAENAGTQVTTDIIVLRKKDGQTFSHGNDFVNLGDTKTANGEDIRVNQYFANHPQNILGNLSLDGSMYGGGKEMTVHSDPNRPASIALAQALESLPENIVATGSVNSGVVTGKVSAVKVGSIIEKDGKFYFQGQEKPDEDLNKPKNRAIVREFLVVRDLLNAQYDLELDANASDEAIENNRSKLNRAYDSFVSKNKNFHNRNNSNLLLDDPDYTRVLGSEVEQSRSSIGAHVEKLASALKRDKNFVKADIYTKRIMMPRVQPTKADSVADGLGISLGWKGRVDLPYIASMTGLNIEQAEKALLEGGMVVRDPETGQILTREQYLSGNVRKKLAIAKESGADYERNVEMLQSVQPQNVTIDEVRFKIGATWIPGEIYQKFLNSLGIGNVKITYKQGVQGVMADGWDVDGKMANYRGVDYKDYQTTDVQVVPIINSLLNFRKIAVYKKDETKGADSKPVLSEEATAAARAAAKKLNDRFIAWAKETPEVAEQLAEIYNKEVNAFAQRTYDGQFLQFPWANKDFDIYPDKKNTIWRAIQDGFGLLAHGVGGGKTILGSAIALEMRRLNMARKPMIVVHNATLEGFAKEIAKMAPAARVLVGRKDELQGDKRREFLMRIAAGDWDAVVIAHSTFELIADDPKIEAEHMKSLIDSMTASIKDNGYETIDAAIKDKRKTPTVKNAIKQIERLEALLESASKRKTDTGILNFQQLGVDALIVDEVHRFKKMPFNTKLDAKGIDGAFSKRGYALLMRARAIQEKMGGKNIFTMTGTPVTNTLGEIWNMVRLVAPSLVKDYGIENFDQFVSKFAEVEQASEMTPSGDHKMVDRLSKVVNLPEWATFLRLAADVKLGEDLIVKNRPEIKGGKPELVAVERSAGVTKWVSYIRDVLNKFSEISGKELGENPSLFAVPVQAYMASRAAAIDIRLIQPDAIDEPGSKVNVMIDRLMDIYNQTSDYKGTQVVFADSFNQQKISLFDAVVSLSNLELPNDGSGRNQFNLYDDIKAKLIKRGIPESEIELITDNKYSNPKAKEALFERVNEGQVRVIIGSTESLGTGVNMQKRMAAAHHLDVPWTPAGLEQRDGRVYRQGNIHGEMGLGVELIRYGMKDTLDSALWQKLETKQKFITLALSGNVVGRELEESEEILSLAEQRAVLSGPYGQKIFELETKIKDLEFARAGYNKEASNRVKEIEAAQKAMQNLLSKEKAVEPSLQAMSALAEKISKDGAKIAVNGVEYKTKTELAEAVEAELKSATEKLAADLSGGNIPTSIRSISVNGQPIILIGKMTMKADMAGIDQPYYSFELANSDLDSQNNITFGRVTSYPTLASRLEELGETISAIKSSIKNNADRIRQLAEMNPLAGWPLEAEYQKAIAELQKTREEMAEANGVPKKPSSENVSQESQPLLAKPRQPRLDWPEMLNKANDISIQEFAELSKSGRLIQATGQPNEFEAGSGKTPLSLGAGAGYSLNDIAHFYIARQLPTKFQGSTDASRLVNQLVSTGKDPALSNTVLKAFDRFAIDAAVESQADKEQNSENRVVGVKMPRQVVSWDMPTKNTNAELVFNSLIAGRGQPAGMLVPKFDANGNLIAEEMIPTEDDIEFRHLDAPLGSESEYLTKDQMRELIGIRGTDRRFWNRNNFEIRELSYADRETRPAKQIRFSNAVVTDKPGPVFIKQAYHGTPHKVDKFSAKKIGTGEGSQAFGWGLYFAENKNVAEDYRSKLSGQTKMRPDGSARNPSANGNLYSVDLDVESEDLLDWDKPLSKQSNKVKDALKSVQSTHWLWNDTISGKLGDPVGGAVYKNLTATWPDAEFTQEQIDPREKASDALIAAGIPGIRYLDQDSRGILEVRYNYQDREYVIYNVSTGLTEVFPVGENKDAVKKQVENRVKELKEKRTYNFVIFDENKIRIIAENGKDVGNIAMLSAKTRPMRGDTTGELFGDQTPFNLVGEMMTPEAPAKPDIVVDAQAREEAFRKSGQEDVGDLFDPPTVESIAATAVIDKDGVVLSSPSKTHAELMEETKFDLDGGEFPPTQNFGFVTSNGRFVEQKEAQEIAQKANQVQGNQPISGEIVTALGRDGMLPSAPISAKTRKAPKLPSIEQRIEASLDAIEKWNDFLRAVEEKPAGSLKQFAETMKANTPQDIWRGYQTIFRGRLDVADALAPGVKAILQAAKQEEALAQLGVNAVVDGLRRELQKAFGDPAFWNKNRARLKEATRLLLPVASYLQPERAGRDGGFDWREFERRAGTISQVEARKMRLKDGQWFEYNDRTYRLGDFLPDEKAFVLLEPVSAEMQQAIYEEFWNNFPEAVPILDRWITPDLKDAYTVGLGSTMSVEFNREALLSFMNEWPEDLKKAFGDMTLPTVPRVEGYTPDIGAQRSIIAIIAKLLGVYKSPGRKFKTGALREAGNIKNLVDGFSTRAMEAHREKIRMRMRQGIIEKAVVLKEEIPAENIGDYVTLEDVFSSIVKSVEAARLLDEKAYPHLSKALNPKDQVQLMRLVGDAARLNGIEQMIHKNVYRELMLSMARAQSEGMLLRTLNFLLRGAKLGKLAAGSVGINWLGNQILTVTQAMNRMFQGMTHLLIMDSKGAKINALESLFLLRGLITDRAPNTINQSRIGDLIPRELFDSSTALASMDAGADYGNLVDDIKRNGILRGPSQGLVNAFKQGGISASILYAVHYSGGDAAVKQQSAYAAYRARAEVAANEAKIKSGRTEWMRNWIQQQVNGNTEIHQEVMDAAKLYFMDYENVPAWLDPSASLPEEKARKFLKEHGLWFIKYPYNFIRFVKRLGMDGAVELVSPSSTRQERAKGLANMLTIAAIAYGGAALLSGGDDDDDIIGSRFDDEGKLKDRDQDTSSRMNLSAIGRKTQLGRVIATALRMAGVSINDDLTNHRGDDYWMYYQNITWMKEALLMGRAVNGDYQGFLKDAGAYISDLTALGILSRMMGIAKVGSIDAKKSPVNLATEAFFETLSSPVNPSSLTEYIGNMTDPVVRRTTSSKSLDFNMGPIESIMAKIPGLRKNLPVAGDPIKPALLTTNFDRDKRLAQQATKIRNNTKLSPAEKDAAISKLQAQRAEQASRPSPTDLTNLFWGMGINPDKIKPGVGTTTRDIVGDLARLQSMGAGPESVKVFDEKLPSGETRTYITYPDPDNVAVRDPFFSLFKIATGVNIRPFPSQKKITGKAPSNFIFTDPQANLTLPKQ